MNQCNRNIFSMVLFMMILFSSNAQEVEKTTLVEHFTNTRCSVCASRNPGFYAAKKQKPKVLHVAYHPSSPYNNCLFSTQNKSENDARTNYYNLYGATPTFTINGVEKSSSAVQNVSVYTPYENQTSPISVDVEISPSGNDSIRVLVEIKAVSAHSLENLALYVPIIEDTVFYNALNGEKQHYDVFRQSISGTNAISFKAPLAGGSSYIYTAKVAINQLWNLKRLSALAIVSAPDKAVIQAEQSDLFSDVLSSLGNELLKNKPALTLYPNPSLNILYFNVELPEIGSNYNICNTKGNIVKSGMISQKEMSVEIGDIPPGTYVIRVGTSNSFVSKTFLKI